MLAIIIWLLIELIFIINGLLDKDKQNKYKIKINVFKIEEIGGLRPLNSFVLFTVSNYFIIITLFIISYIPPNETNFYNILITPEIVILILMLLIGVILFFITQIVIRKLINEGVRLELERTNQNYQAAYEKVIEICSNKKTNDDKYELEKLQVTMDILEKEKTKINQILEKKFETKTISTFSASFLPPSFVLIQKITGLNLSDNLFTYIMHIITIKIRI
jgi:ABC-type multidrug transport system fused ATPase/permease subunit